MGGKFSAHRTKKGTVPYKRGVVEITSNSILVTPTMSSDKKFEAAVIEAHNILRKNHNVDAVSHKKDLSKHAQKWADHIASKGTLQHSNDSNYGENIAMTSKSDPTGIHLKTFIIKEIMRKTFLATLTLLSLINLS